MTFFKLNYTPYNVLTIKDMCREREREIAIISTVLFKFVHKHLVAFDKYLLFNVSKAQ